MSFHHLLLSQLSPSITSGGYKEGGQGFCPPPLIDRKHLRTGENFAEKCIILHKNFKNFLGRGHSPSPDPTSTLPPPYSKLLDPSLSITPLIFLLHLQNSPSSRFLNLVFKMFFAFYIFCLDCLLIDICTLTVDPQAIYQGLFLLSVIHEPTHS